jgi:hypothetical protein
MARKVFFSFHYRRDVFRVQIVRESWVIRMRGEAQPFYDKAEFEQVKRTVGIENWIERQLHGTSVTVVLYGAETSERRWVRHEIRRSRTLGKGILAIDIHGINAMQRGPDVPGKNPLDCVFEMVNGRPLPLSVFYRAYNWERDNGYQNMSAWIEAAARAVGR